jgi:hypothetical protein
VAALTEHQRFTAVWGARTAVKYGLVALWALVFFALLFFTHLASDFGGTPKQRALALAILTGAPFAVAYFPLAWAVGRFVKRRLV